MLFNSYEFLFLFLPLVLVGYYAVVRPRWRLGFLTVVSYLFYGWWDFRFCSLMLISTVVDYIAGKKIHASSGTGTRKRWLLLSMVSNLSLLGFFKYYDLAAGTFNHGLSFLPGMPAELLPHLSIVLPVGISFYTFQSMSYSIDIYLGAAKPARGIWAFACYVALFPQLIAGPIVRYRELAEQLVHRTHTVQKFAAGMAFFIVGLGKKVILADGVSHLSDLAFGASELGVVTAWCGTLAYTLQIYFDFSGYSDMAVGLGLMFGFQLPQNFNSPYKSVSITEFWRRWHISLSSWLRDYLYIPLGGNRCGEVRTFVNLFLTMLLGGLWHGASWTFVFWGGFHGLLLASERMIGKRSLFWWAPVAVQRAGTFVLVMIGWVFFRAETFADAVTMLRGMIGLSAQADASLGPLLSQRLPLIVMVLAIAVVWGFPNTWQIRWRPGWRLALALAALFGLCIMVILVNTSSPFLYFQF